ncbi:MAG TPA: hypothetical protein DCY94_05440 [Firmicutes bacterium]|nr:hypothetical protein [Bacillota bacterium]
MKLIKKLGISIFICFLLLIGIVISYYRCLLKAYENKTIAKEYMIDEQIDTGKTLERCFLIENTLQSESYFDIYWKDLKNEFGSSALSYILEYRDTSSVSWIQIGTATEYVPGSEHLNCVLASSIPVPGNTSLIFKLTIRNEKDIEKLLQTDIIITRSIELFSI